MKLVACSRCHAQFDVTSVADSELRCHCGKRISTAQPEPIDAEVRRCGSCGAGVDSEAAKCGYCDSILRDTGGSMGLICPECYARNSDRSSFCTACGVEFRPLSPHTGESEEYPCPVCEEVNLSQRAIGDVRVFECARCNGLWAPETSFEALVERATESYRAKSIPGLGEPTSDKGRRSKFDSRVVYRACPECGGRMQRKNFGRKSGVIIDWCGIHGTWLDPDELEDIAAFIAAGGLGVQSRDDEFVKVRAQMNEERRKMKERAEKRPAPVGLSLEQERPFTLLGLLKFFLE